MPATDSTYLQLGTFLHRKTKSINRTLRQILSEQNQINKDFKKVLNYTLLAPGKRIRAALVLLCCETVSGKTNNNAFISAAAIEMVHTYSLVHDDLPAMDNDDLRRGRPSCHKAFDEATAILAGDALLTLAFEVLANKIDEPIMAVKLISELAQAAGPEGMIAGQIADLKCVGTKSNQKLLADIHTNKTAKMFCCAAAMGAISGRANNRQLSCLRQFGLKIGLGFQIADDILDVCSSTQQLGKTAGKDSRQDKCTYPAIIGIEKSKKLARKLSNEAVATLKLFGAEADVLRRLAKALLTREK